MNYAIGLLSAFLFGVGLTGFVARHYIGKLLDEWNEALANWREALDGWRDALARESELIEALEPALLRTGGVVDPAKLPRFGES